jgi:hypothetical protein
MKSLNFFNRLTFWTWIELLFFIFVCVVDNLQGNTDALWCALVIVGINCAIIFNAERVYKFQLPVNHPDQELSDKDVLGNFVRSLFCILLCVASIRLGSTWMAVAGATMMILSSFVAYKSLQLLFFVGEDVKYEA